MRLRGSSRGLHASFTPIPFTFGLDAVMLSRSVYMSYLEFMDRDIQDSTYRKEENAEI
jgi:hypothetical protein